MHNSLGFDIFMFLLDMTDEPYHESVTNLILKWNKSIAIHNIGRIFEILFLHVSENIRVKILNEIGNIPPIEMLKFFSLFDTHLYDGYVEEGLLL